VTKGTEGNQDPYSHEYHNQNSAVCAKADTNRPESSRSREMPKERSEIASRLFYDFFHLTDLLPDLAADFFADSFGF
jgi:hypothetical protein